MSSVKSNEHTLRRRFYQYVDIPPDAHLNPNACWTWTGSLHFSGDRKTHYGQIGTSKGTEVAHRVSYRLHHPETPTWESIANYRIRPTCGNSLCVRPDHLVATPLKDRPLPSQTGIRRGENHPHARLTDDIVLAIRRDPRTQREICQHYGLRQSHVSLIQSRRIWSHVPDQPPQEVPDLSGDLLMSGAP